MIWEGEAVDAEQEHKETEKKEVQTMEYNGQCEISGLQDGFFHWQVAVGSFARLQRLCQDSWQCEQTEIWRGVGKEMEVE